MVLSILIVIIVGTILYHDIMSVFDEDDDD